MLWPAYSAFVHDQFVSDVVAALCFAGVAGVLQPALGLDPSNSGVTLAPALRRGH